MALNVQTGVLVAPTTISSQTISLPTDFNPKLILAWTAGRTATGIARENIQWSMGGAAMWDAVARRCYISYFDLNAAASNDSARGCTNAFLLKGFTAGTAAIDYTCTLTSMGQGATSNVVLNWANPPAAAIQVFYVIFGGDVNATAITSSVNTNTGITAFPLGASGVNFGHPDVIWHIASGGTEATAGDYTGGGGLCGTMLAAGVRGDGSSDAVTGVKSRASMLYTLDGGATMIMGGWQKDSMVLKTTTAQAADMDEFLEPETGGNWSTDGYALNTVDPPATSTRMGAICLKDAGTAGLIAEAGSATAPTAVAPQTQVIGAKAGTPKLVMLWGLNLPASGSIDTSTIGLGQFFIGAYDGTAQSYATWMQLDVNTAALNSRAHRTDKAIAFYVPAATATLQSEASASFVGEDVTLTWNDTDTVDREFNYLIIREAGGEPPPIEKVGSDTLSVGVTDTSAIEAAVIVAATDTLSVGATDASQKDATTPTYTDYNPDAILSQTGISGALSTVQDDVDAPDANWMTATGTSQIRVSFPTPADAPLKGTGEQTFRIRARL